MNHQTQSNGGAIEQAGEDPLFQEISSQTQ